MLGKTGGHNVVVAVLPEIGNSVAATVATQLLNDFPSIRFGVLVDIGGGVPEEDSLAASPVEVAYPSPAYGVSPEEAPFEKSPAGPKEGMLTDAPAEGLPAEEYPITEEAPPPAKEAYDAAEETPPAEEPPAAEEVPAESEAVEQTDVSTRSRAEDSDGEGANITEKLGDQAGEVVLLCISCTTMILIEYDGPCPYSIKSLMGSNYDSYSWLLHTTCLSPVNQHKDKLASRDSFGNECMAAFIMAILSEEFKIPSARITLAPGASTATFRETDADTNVNHLPNSGLNASAAVNNKSFGGVTAILAMGRDLNIQIVEGWTPFFVAACRGLLDLSRLLLKAGAHVNSTNREGTTALKEAAQIGAAELVQLLVEHKADIEAIKG
jgi:Ankyrin repeats (3 copies)